MKNNENLLENGFTASTFIERPLISEEEQLYFKALKNMFEAETMTKLEETRSIEVDYEQREICLKIQFKTK